MATDKQLDYIGSLVEEGIIPADEVWEDMSVQEANALLNRYAYHLELAGSGRGGSAAGQPEGEPGQPAGQGSAAAPPADVPAGRAAAAMHVALWAAAGCIPILDIFAVSAALDWARDAAMGRAGAMPGMFSLAKLKKGIAVMLLYAVCNAVLDMVGGGTASRCALAALLTPAVSVLVMRYAMFGRMAQAFRPVKIAVFIARNPAKVAAATLLPAGAAFAAVTAAGCLAGAAPLLGAAAFPAAVSLYAVSMFASNAAFAVSFRVLGRIVAGNAADWVEAAPRRNPWR